MAGSAVIEEQKFSLQEVLDTFKLCLSENQDVYVEHYVAGWRGLVKFMNSLGNVFTFISRDGFNKIQILVNFLNGENGSHYVTIQSMVKYELDNQLVDLDKRGSHPESGSRTLLHLHRTLRWLELFFERLRTSTEDSKTSVMCTDAYIESLSQHHPLGIQTAVLMAFRDLPGRPTFFEVMNVGGTEKVVDMLGDAVPMISKVYQITEDLYAQNNLLELP